MNNKWEIEERLTDEQLDNQTDELSNQYISKDYKHKNGEVYTIIDITIININRKAYWGFVYVKQSHKSANFTRPLYEFLDGRFTLVE